jgi:general secretion pathway protein A
MSYYKILGLDEEPFSTSPDPAFFYESLEHREALVRLEIAIKLKRGASLVLGDVGTGKTTLSRKLFSAFSDKSKYDFGMILDPAAESEQQFMESLVEVYDLKPENSSLHGLKKAMERFLFQKGVDENRTVVLLVDEAQKLTPESMEALRTLLNYETNKFKLLQLVLMGQMELLPEIRKIRNFWERIALKYVINPLSEAETREMIEFRLKQAGYRSARPLFDAEALEEVFAFTQGCPRRINLVCHNALELAVMKNRPSVDRGIIQELVSEEMRIVRHVA